MPEKYIEKNMRGDRHTGIGQRKKTDEKRMRKKIDA